MSSTQAKILLPNARLGVAGHPSCPSYIYASRLSFLTNRLGESHRLFPRLVYSQPNRRRFDPLCLATGNSNNNNRGFPWESSNNGGGGQLGGRAGDGGDGSQEDKNLSESMDEVLQVVLATIGFIFVYAYLLMGAELTRLARDYIRYLFGSPATPRMMRTMSKWRDFYAEIIETAEIPKVLLGRIAVAAPILLQNPRKLVELMRPADC